MVTASDTPLDRERLYQGEILMFRGMPAMSALVAQARAMACEAFAPHAPPDAQQSLDPAQFRARAGALRRSFMRDAQVRASFRAMIESLGLDPAATGADRLILRLQPSGDTHRGRRMRDLPAHRDTWGSNIMAQINLWGPVFPVEPGATMVIWPALFDRAVPNTSAEWDLVLPAPQCAERLPAQQAPSGGAAPARDNAHVVDRAHGAHDGPARPSAGPGCRSRRGSEADPEPAQRRHSISCMPRIVA